MSRLLLPVVVALSCFVAACAGDDSGETPSTSNLDVATFDRAVDPCVDPNAYVNGKWLAQTEIPAQRGSIGVLSEMLEPTLDAQHALAEEALTRADSAAADSAWRRVGWFYRSGMDTAAMEALGISPVAPLLGQIDAITSHQALAQYLGARAALGSDELIGVSVDAAQDRPDTHALHFFPTGLGLPATAYYTEPQYAPAKDAYQQYLATLFLLAGHAEAQASTWAATVVRIETALAAHMPSPEEAYYPENQFRRTTLADVQATVPAFDWSTFLQAMGDPATQSLSLAPAPYFVELNRLLAATSLEDWRIFLQGRAFNQAAPYLSQAWRDASDAFYRVELEGTPAALPHWHTVLDTLNQYMGQSMGELYSDRHFDDAHRTAAEAIVEQVRAALLRRVEQVDWMSDTTRAMALRKIANMQLNIGFPEQWDDWSGVPIRSDSFYANVQTAQAHSRQLNLAQLGTPVRRDRWFLDPQVLNAVYDPLRNAMTFTAAILQAPIFDLTADPALNLGGLGAVAGHEMTHAIDNSGRLYDDTGRLNDWWEPADAANFEARTARLIAQAEAYVPLSSDTRLRMNGHLTLGENIADLGGLAAASDALLAGIASGLYSSRAIDGYLPQQRVFLAWVRNWREKFREPTLRLLLETDAHPPGEFRATNPPANIPAYAQAFQCRPGQPMALPESERTDIW